jgi:hypothetical protein
MSGEKGVNTLSVRGAGEQRLHLRRGHRLEEPSRPEIPVETLVFSNECLNLGQRPRRLLPAIIHDGTSDAECSNGGLPAGIEEPG